MRADRRSFPPLNAPRRGSLALAVALALTAAPLAAQQPSTMLDPHRPGLPQVAPNAPQNAQVAEVVVTLDRDAFVADGVSRVGVKVELRDAEGKLVTKPATITIEASGGRVLLPGAQTDELGPGALDRDRVTPGVQLDVTDGVGHFSLLAPVAPQDVRLRVTAGAATAEGLVTFDPELRQMLAVGLIEGVIALSSRSPDAVRPVNIDDGFEYELRSWSRRFGADDRNTAAVRGAMFLKGKIRGDALLTLAYDSETDTRKRLMRDVRADEYYPVYGDASVRGFDAQSMSKLYVRIDKDKHYLLYGDFNTSAQFSPLTGGRMVAPLRMRDLGQYNRTVTGARGHWETKDGFANVFATRDTLKQAVEEYAANGTSGPFAVRANGALAGSETVEIVTRDRNNRSVVLSVEPLARLADYVFEPFSGRILLNRPLASVDPNGNPVSIRITYELDQGGDPFWLYGADGQYRLGSAVEIGGSWVEDKNDLAPYRLGSANAGLRLGENTQLVAEFARSEGSYNTTGSNLNQSGGLAGVTGDASGNAARVALDHKSEDTQARLYYGRSDTDFDNPSASFSGGRGDAGLRAAHKLSDTVTVFGEAVRSEDRLQDGWRNGAQLGASFKATDRLTLDAALKVQKENGNPVSASTGLGANPSGATGTSTSPLTPSGGFFGTGADPIDPATGNTLLPGTTGSTSSGAGQPLDATTLQLGARYRATDAWSLGGEVEHDVSGDDKRRYMLGASYQLAERSRLYARWERQQGLASIYSLNPADKSTSFVFGADTTYLGDTQFFSEYRLRDAMSDAVTGRDAQLANGLRNTWQAAPGLRVVTGAEYMKVLDGSDRAAFALVGGVDYTANPLWKASARLEWRRLQDDPGTVESDRQDSWLSTVTVARKLDRDWTLLVRNYALLNQFEASGDRLQDRFQVGFAYRPVDHNRVNALGKYEFKHERDESGDPSAMVGTELLPTQRDVHIVSLHADYHPSRPWWMTGRAAAKALRERITNDGGWDSYQAYLLSGRVVYDVTENWDVGLLAAGLYSPQGHSLQKALGAEVGYLLKTNLWMSLGFNLTGFSDRDLTAGEYTARGWFIRLRFKFDETLFAGRDPEINRALDRPAR